MPTHACKTALKTLDGQNRQSPIASVQRTRSTLAGHSAVPRRANVTRMNANRAIQIAAQRTQGLGNPEATRRIGLSKLVGTLRPTE